MAYQTEQEAFWAGEFGTEYISRNQSDELLASNLVFFSKALSAASKISSCVEFGANVGMNLKALKLLYPKATFHGIEINADAAQELKGVIGSDNAINGSILEISPPECDLALIKGVLIHLNPDMLEQVYAKLVSATRRWLLVAEYYNPTPTSVTYRGHEGRLFKRDFAGEILKSHPEMKLVDYGFSYHLDPQFPQDDISWFLMEKAS